MHRTRDFAALGVALLLAGALLSPLLQSGFLTDDYHYVRMVNVGPRHAETWDPSRPTEVFKVFWTQASREFELYRPLVILSYAFNYHFWGGTDPKPYQAFNLIVHLLGGAAAFFLMRRLMPRAPPWAVAVGTFAWLISPIQLEVVAWSATRSDAFSFLFGALALAVKLGRPQRLILPAVLAALSLLSKEQAVFWIGTLFLVDFLEPASHPGAAIKERFAKTLRRGWPLLLLLVAYFLLRLELFGSSFQKNAYAKKDFDSFFSLALWARYGRSARVLAMPISTLAFPSGWTRVLLMAGSGLGTASCLLLGLPRLRRLKLLPSLVLVILFFGPFLLAVMVNEVGSDLVNTRACYTPMFAVGALIALATASGKAGRTASVLVLSAWCLASVPSQELYVDAHRGVEESLASIRTALRSPALEGRNHVAILGYREQDYFRGSFDLSGAIRPALQRPFMDRDWQLDLVGADIGRPNLEHWTPFPELFAHGNGSPHDRDDLVLLAMTDAGEGRLTTRLAHPGRRAPPNIQLVRPEPGERREISVGPFEARFAFLAPNLDPTRLALLIVEAGGVAFGERPLPVSAVLRSKTPKDEGRFLFEIAFPLPEAALEQLPNSKFFGFAVQFHGENDPWSAASPLRLFQVARP